MVLLFFIPNIHLTEFQRIAYDKAVRHIKREHLSAAKCIVPNDELLANKTLENILEKLFLTGWKISIFKTQEIYYYLDC